METRGDQAALPHIRTYLGLKGPAFTDLVKTMMRSRYGFISELAGQFLGSTDEIANIISSAQTQTKFLSDPQFADPDKGVLTGDDFRFADFKQEVASLYLILPQKYLAPYARFLRLMVVSALDGVMTTKGPVKTVFLLDEFKALGHLSAIETAFSLAAGYNVQIWPFIQNLNQLRSVYGETGWADILSGCGFLQFFAPTDDFTAEFVSKRIGDYTQFVASTSSGISDNAGTSHGDSSGLGWKRQSSQSGSNASSGTSQSTSWSKVGLRLYPPQNVRTLPSDKGIVFLGGLKHAVLAVRRPYYRVKGLKEHAAPDPFYPEGT